MARHVEKTDLSATEGGPPPLPGRAPTSLAGALARVKAFLAIRRLRAADAFRRAAAGLRRRPRASIAIGVVAAVAIAAGAYLAREGVPEIETQLFAPKNVAEARAAAREHPSDAAAQRALGHQLWASKKRHAALLAYGRSLALDRGAADADVAAHLVASFGTRDQELAETLIWKNKVVAAQPRLEPLVKSPKRSVRWGAVHTLDKLEKGTRANWETAYILDLDSKECDVRRTAVDKLGAIGTRRAVAALQAAKARDEKTGGFFRSRCLGDRLDDAEQKILARR